MSGLWEEELESVLEDLNDAEEPEDREEEGWSANHDADRLEDAHMAETVARRALTRFRWAGKGLGWMRYRQGRWEESNESAVAERVRKDLIDQHANEARRGAPIDRLQKLSGLLSVSRIRGIVKLCEGITECQPSAFDQHPDLLNVGNGVVDLTTGELLPHDPELMLTKITRVHYQPDEVSQDWATALGAVPEDVADWLQVRVGQAATGHPTPDDVLPILQGGGSNGKTTITGAISRALGDHAVMVPERALLANKSDHPTELMTFRGARLALIEETPEARHLNVKRLKDTVGTPTMTARKISRDNVTWDTTHSLFITSNYVPRVDEVDHGTWRRLALVRFPHRYVPDPHQLGPGDQLAVPGLRERLRDGRHGEHEAILAWIIAGARRWYDADQVIPPPPRTVVADTRSWRIEADLILAYITERLVFDADRHVPSRELYQDYETWLTGRGHVKVSETTFSARFAEHFMVTERRVTKGRTRSTEGVSRRGWDTSPLSKQYTAWMGVRLRDPGDSMPPEGDDDTAADLREHDGVQGVQGQLVGSREGAHISNDQITLHTLHTPSPHCSACGQKLLHPGSLDRGICARCRKQVAS